MKLDKMDTENDYFSWIGDGDIKNRRNKYQLHYKEFECRELRVAVDDFVMVSNEDSLNPTSPDSCFVGQVKDLYDKGVECEDRHQAVIQWFLRFYDLPPRNQRLFPSCSQRNELLQDLRPTAVEHIDAETIFDTCKVLFLPSVGTKVAINMEIDGMVAYFCRWKFDGNNALSCEKSGSSVAPSTPRSSVKNGHVSTPKSSRKADTATTPKTPKQSNMAAVRRTPRTARTPASRMETPRSSKVTATTPQRGLARTPRSKPPSTPTSTGKHLANGPSVQNSRRTPVARKLELGLPSSAAEYITRSGRKSKPLIQEWFGDGVVEDPSRGRLPLQKRKLFDIKDIEEEDIDDTEKDLDYKLEKMEISSSSEEEDVQDEDFLSAKRSKIPRTPSRFKNLCRTPTTPRQRLESILLPKKTPTTPRNKTNLDDLRSNLHVSFVPEALPCREQELSDIYNFLEGKLQTGTGGCMYISGVPGTGKTATVHEAIRYLYAAVDAEEIPDFRFIEVNGMKVTDPYQVYPIILKALTGEKATADQAAEILSRRFGKSSSGPRQEPVVILVDELDLLWTRKQTVMYNLFDWPSRPGARLVVIAIANTMDLPERMLLAKVASRLGLTRMTFEPYSFSQLQKIVSSRLQDTKCFSSDAVELAARKVAAVSGDARRALDVCRRAVDIAEGSPSSPKKNGVRPTVTLSHVDAAIQEMYTSPITSAIKFLSEMEHIFLRALVSDCRRTAQEEAHFPHVYKNIVELCRLEGVPELSVSQSLVVSSKLAVMRILSTDSDTLDYFHRVRLNVNINDVELGLKQACC